MQGGNYSKCWYEECTQNGNWDWNETKTRMVYTSTEKKTSLSQTGPQFSPHAILALHTFITSSDTPQTLVASALEDRTVVNCTWTDPEPNPIENPSNTQLEDCGTLSLPISEVWTHWWLLLMHVDIFCIYFEYLYMSLFLFVTSLLYAYAGLTWKSAIEAEVTTCENKHLSIYLSI